MKAEYAYVKQYCPFTNMKKMAYASMLVMISLNNSQVLYYEPTKFVTIIRTLKTDSNPLLLRCNMDARHSGASGQYDHLKEDAFVMSFVLTQMGIRG